jgi:hypothetical protein
MDLDTFDLMRLVKVLPDSEKSGMWHTNSRNLNDTIASAKDLPSLFQLISGTFHFSIDGIAKGKKNEIEPAIQWMAGLYPDIHISPISKFITDEVQSNGLSVNHLLVSIIRHRIETNLKRKKVKFIMELGAGFGALARELILSNPSVKYVVVDLRESLMFSYTYLSLEFPDKKHVMLESADQIPNLQEDYDVLYISASFFKEWSRQCDTKFDLFVNTCSLGEMTNNLIKDYYHGITYELNIKYYYWLNRFLTPQKAQKECDGCAGLIPKEWNILSWEYMPDFLLCPWIMPSHSRMAEIFAKKVKTPDVPEPVPAVDYRGYPSFCLDRTKYGLLFKFWNLQRLDPCEDNKKRIVDYIKFIAPESCGKMEELSFYGE